MKKPLIPILLATAFGALLSSAQETSEPQEVDCSAISESVASEVSADKSRVLEIVSERVGATPECVCEIVKSAIKASEADSQTVAAIVETAISKAPEQVDLIAQCATAAAPDASDAIKEVLAEVAAMTNEFGTNWNPLDFPGDNESPITGFGIITSGPQGDNAPPVVNTPAITDPNP